MSPPDELTIQLRVLASKERSQYKPPVPWVRNCGDRLKLFLDNLMKPLAIPAAGGLTAAVILFTCFMPTLGFDYRVPPAEDIPIYEVAPSTDPILRSVPPIGFQFGDAEVDLRIDAKGRIINCWIVSGDRESSALRRSIENNLLFTTFTPATAYGVPTVGKIRLSFRTSRIDVKG
jgi:hypothetical protein